MAIVRRNCGMRPWVALAVALGLLNASHLRGEEARVWVTTQDQSHRLAAGPPVEFVKGLSGGKATGATEGALRIHSRITYQTILGMGSSLEPATCYNLSRLEKKQRDEVLARLFDPDAGIGMNLARICIGTPDFTGEPWYSYDDPPSGQPDPELKYFSIDKDRPYILPVLKAARAKNPQLLLFASPWSPPGWMKSSRSMVGGHLLPEYYAVYARYFVKFLQAYQREGLPIHAVTVQNEPGVDREHEAPKWHYPSCRWTGGQERDFIRDHLGPALKQNGLATKIWCYDHNYNVAPTPDGDDPGIDYPRQILKDLRAAKFVDGVAFHGYAGTPEGMSTLRKEFPQYPVYFTEGSVFGLAGSKRLIDLLLHGASAYNGWVTMIDDTGKPNNGPFRARRTCIMLTTNPVGVDYTLDYYLYAQFMKFIRRGAVRLDVTPPDARCPAIAFKNPDDQIVLIAVNLQATNRSVDVSIDDWHSTLRLLAQSVSTVVWRGE